jgi:uncharacterized glyoxalase superfamily protein PhnB
MHACIKVGNNLLMGSDGPPGYNEEAKGFYVSLGIDDPAEAERLFQVLSEKGTGTYADTRNLLGDPFRHVGRSVRDPLHSELRETEITSAYILQHGTGGR